MVARNAGVAFAVRLLSNHSTENPRGIMSKDVHTRCRRRHADNEIAQDIFKSFWGVVDGEDGQLEYKKGYERIPTNWFKTPVDYGLVQLNLDLVSWISKYPELASIGGNTGEVNTFTPLNITGLPEGLMNVPTLLENNNLLCFVLQIVGTFAPDSLSGIFDIIAKPLKLLTDTLGADLLDLSCPPAQELGLDDSEPVWEKLTSSYAGPKRAGSCL